MSDKQPEMSGIPEDELLNTAAAISFTTGDVDVFVDWLIEHHGLRESSRAIVRNNLRAAIRCTVYGTQL